MQKFWDSLSVDTPLPLVILTQLSNQNRITIVPFWDKHPLLLCADVVYEYSSKGANSLSEDDDAECGGRKN